MSSPWSCMATNRSGGGKGIWRKTDPISESEPPQRRCQGNKMVVVNPDQHHCLTASVRAPWRSAHWPAWTRAETRYGAAGGRACNGKAAKAHCWHGRCNTVNTPAAAASVRPSRSCRRVRGGSAVRRSPLNHGAFVCPQRLVAFHRPNRPDITGLLQSQRMGPWKFATDYGTNFPQTG